MALSVSPDRQRRYLTDAEFHARVDLVAHALWEAVCRFDLGHREPFPYERLAGVTQADLVAYAIAAVEAMDGAFVLRSTADALAEAVEQATKPGQTFKHAMHSLPAALRRYREATVANPVVPLVE